MTVSHKSLQTAEVAIWLDDLSRGRLTSSSLASMVEAGEIENAGGDVMTDGAVSSAGGEELKPAAPAAGGPATSAAKDHVER